MSRDFTISHGAYSDIGLVRKENQDAYGAFPEGRPLLMVKMSPFPGC